MNKSKFKSALPLTVGICLLALSSCKIADGTKGPESYRFYVGSGDWRLEKPIFLCELDPQGMAITVLDSFRAEGGAGYLALSPDGHYLYATSGISVAGEEGFNSVAAYRIVEDNGLEFINRQSSHGSGNCHVGIHPDGKFVFAANYSSGHAAALPAGDDGSLSAASSVVVGQGTGPVTHRQEGPHAHQVVTDPSGTYLLVPDLGTDKVMNYAFDRKSGTLSPNPAQPWLDLPPGTGPRHLAFSPDGAHVYILGELNASLTACSFAAENGVLTPVNTASIVEEGFEGNRQSAAVRVHPNGKFIYATNRDDVSQIAVFAKEQDGSISRIQLLSGVAYWPRDFNLSPDGLFLVLAGARANMLELYAIDPGTGMLHATEKGAEVRGPICVVFIP